MVLIILDSIIKALNLEHPLIETIYQLIGRKLNLNRTFLFDQINAMQYALCQIRTSAQKD